MSERQEQWEARYASVDRLWSGEPNEWLPELAADWAPGAALDIGCGEGDDALWLAGRGWEVTGVDLSPTAVGRLRDGARRAGLDGRVRALVLDVAAEPLPAGPFDLVTSFYVHGGPAPGALELESLLTDAAARVAPGGRLLTAVHCVNPPWHRHGARTYQPDELLAALGRACEGWGVELVEERRREAVGPDGAPGHRSDSVLCLRRPGR